MIDKPMNPILDEVYEIFDKYEDGDCINPYLYDGNLRDELEDFLLEKKREQLINDFSVESSCTFDSPGITTGAISVCWIDEFGLQHLMYDWEIR